MTSDKLPPTKRTALTPTSRARIFLGWGVCGCAGGAGWQVGGSPGGWDPKWGSHNLFRLVIAGKIQFTPDDIDNINLTSQ
eukprot:scaffold17304_cov54-Cyclotella_meneghiniana.AAC.5